MANSELIFMGISLAGLAGLFVYARQLVSTPNLPSDFDFYLRTSGLSPQVTLITSLIVDCFEFQHGNRVHANLPNNQVTMPSWWVQGACDEQVAQAASFNLIIDGDDYLNISLSSDKRFTPTSIDITNYDERAGGPNRAHIHGIHLKSSASESILIVNGLHIHEIVVSDMFRGHVWILNSWVRRVVLETNNSDKLPGVHISDSWVGSLFFNAKCCGELKIIGGGVNRIFCTPLSSTEPTQSNAFTGDVAFVQTPPLRCVGGNVSNDPQAYRNLRNHLSDLGNVDAEKYVQAFEKRMDRPNQGTFAKFISVLYDATAFYGTLPGRAFIWLVGITVYTCAIVFFFDAAVAAVNCSGPDGWPKSMCGDALLPRLIRSVTLSLQPVIHPFNVFTQNAIVTASSFWLNIWLIFQSLISLSLMALIVIGIRRKFISR